MSSRLRVRPAVKKLTNRMYGIIVGADSLKRIPIRRSSPVPTVRWTNRMVSGALKQHKKIKLLMFCHRHSYCSSSASRREWSCTWRKGGVAWHGTWAARSRPSSVLIGGAPVLSSLRLLGRDSSGPALRLKTNFRL